MTSKLISTRVTADPASAAPCAEPHDDADRCGEREPCKDVADGIGQQSSDQPECGYDAERDRRRPDARAFTLPLHADCSERAIVPSGMPSLSSPRRARKRASIDTLRFVSHKYTPLPSTTIA